MNISQMYAISKENSDEQMAEIEDLKIKLQNQFKENLSIEMSKKEVEGQVEKLKEKLRKSESQQNELKQILEKHSVKQQDVFEANQMNINLSSQVQDL